MKKMIKGISAKKRVVMLIAMGVLAVSILAGCGNSGGGGSGEATIDQVIALMSQDDAKVVEALGEGKVRKDEDGSIENRDYEANVFNEAALLSISYDDNKVEDGTILLTGQDIAPYKALMESAYGKSKTEKITDEVGQDAGIEVYSWQVKKAEIKLMMTYGLASIEIDLK